MQNLILILVGLALGFWTRKRHQLNKQIAFLVFDVLLPLVVFSEFSSLDITHWKYFFFGSGFVLALYYLSRAIGFDKYHAALLATAEGGSLGFIIYLAIGREPIYKFLIIDMFGNGLILFSFIYYQLSEHHNIKKFFLNPLIVSMITGLVLNLNHLSLLEFAVIKKTESVIVMILSILIASIIGSQIKFSLSKEIIRSRFYVSFWLIRIAGAIISLYYRLPLALTVLFILPPSFLLPVIYDTEAEKSQMKYASNFIATSLAPSLLLALALIWFSR